jgi:hypothetical protein
MSSSFSFEKASLNAMSVFSNPLLSSDANSPPTFHHETSLTSSGVEEMHAMIFLPHRFHLLLNIILSHDDALIVIYTDYWKAMPFVDSYLETIAE